MGKRATQLSRGILFFLFFLLIVSFITGLGLWYVHEQREKLLEPPAWTKLCQVTHGLTNPLICILYGWLWYSHIPGGWRLMANRKSGAALVIVLGLLIATGAAIYYSQNRHLYFSIHLFLGLALPVCIAIHWWAAKKWISKKPRD